MEKLIKNINSYYKKRNKRPVFQLGSSSPLMIISQAPGRKVHETGIPWNDASGKTLRKWMGVSDEEFYNPDFFSIMPMDFCFPGKGANGDLPPDPECAALWHPKILKAMESNPLKLLIGRYAIEHYLASTKKNPLSEIVHDFKKFLPDSFPLPHPSPRNQNWFKQNSWFEENTLPFLKTLVQQKIKNVKNHQT